MNFKINSCSNLNDTDGLIFSIISTKGNKEIIINNKFNRCYYCNDFKDIGIFNFIVHYIQNHYNNEELVFIIVKNKIYGYHFLDNILVNNIKIENLNFENIINLFFYNAKNYLKIFNSKSNKDILTEEQIEIEKVLKLNFEKRIKKTKLTSLIDSNSIDFILEFYNFKQYLKIQSRYYIKNQILNKQIYIYYSPSCFIESFIYYLYDKNVYLLYINEIKDLLFLYLHKNILKFEIYFKLINL